MCCLSLKTIRDSSGEAQRKNHEQLGESVSWEEDVGNM